MPPFKRYFVVATIGVRDVPVSLVYYQAYTEQGAIHKAIEKCPLIKDGAYINTISATLG